MEKKLTLSEIIAQKKALKELEAMSGGAITEQAPTVMQIELPEEVAKETVVDTVIPASSPPRSGLAAIAAAKESASVIDLDELMDMPLDGNIARDAKIAVDDVVPRIRQLSELSEANLEIEMENLKQALLANPEAVALMLPTDVGLLVKALVRMTGEDIVMQEAKKKKPKEEKVKAIGKMSKEEIAGVDDF